MLPKVLFVCSLNKENSPGVYNKTLSKIKSLKKYIPLDVLAFLSPDSNYNTKEFLFTSNGDYINVIKEILEKHNYEIVFMRYPRVTKQLLELLKLYPDRFIFEHNTLELNELKFGIKSLTLKDWIYLLFRDFNNLKLNYLNPYYNEKKYGPEVLSLSKGGVCISKSVSNHESSRCNNYPILTLGNGVDFDSIDLLEGGINTDKIEILFVSGSSNKWHGLDRLIKGIQEYQGCKKIVLHIVGKYHYYLSKQLKSIAKPHSVIVHGVISRSDINELANQCNIGIGSLALHRLGMYEGSTLKVREYMAMGLPFVLGYNDIDVDENYPYCKQFSSDETPISIYEIEYFINNLKNKMFSSEKMRNESFSLINQDKKMKEVAKFLKSL